MFKFKLYDTDSEDPVEITADSRDILQWERLTKGASFGELGKNLRMTDIYRIAYLASRRLKVLPDEVKNEANFSERFRVEIMNDAEDDEESAKGDPFDEGL